MHDLIRLALALAAQGAARRGRPIAGRVAAMATIALVAGGFAIAAVVCGLDALWIYAEPRLGLAGAPLLVAGVLAVISVAALAMLSYATRRPRPRPPAPVLTPALVQAESRRLFRTNKAPLLLAAVLAGLVASRIEK